MQRYFVKLGYRGTHYHGWQRQPGGLPTVQGTIEGVLSEIAGADIRVVGCGRTDAGVHAREYVLHFDHPNTLRAEWLSIVNHRLPQDVRFYSAWPVESGAHSRYDALSRCYKYRIHTHPDALGNLTSCYVPDFPTDPTLIRAGMKTLTGHHDFRAFCLTPDRHPSTDCTLHSATLSGTSDVGLCFTFTANRFLRGMIRILVYHLLELGRNNLSLQDLEQALKTGERISPRQMPPQGLTLDHLTY